MTPFPWDEAMRFGFGVLRLSPRAFWSMTPRELAHAASARREHIVQPIARDALTQLMTRFPDEKGISNGR